MKCPFCGHLDDKVVDSREARVGDLIRRRRECLKCNRRFTTYERIDEIPYMVIKKDGRREKFVNEAVDRERTTAEIGELLMTRLRKLDKVAYVRFASVYLDFKDVKEFMSELKSLLKERVKK